MASSQGVTISGNVISFNMGNGIALVASTDEGSPAPAGGDDLIIGNRIGTDITGEVAIGNKLDGILINFGDDNTIGGTTSDAMRI